MRLIRAGACVGVIWAASCVWFVRPAVAANSISVAVEKTNDADGDGTFHQSEGAKTAGADVPFRVSVTNNSTVPVTVVSVTDTDSNGNKAAACASLSNATMQPGGSLVCRFTATAYSPPAGGLVSDTIEVAVAEAAAPDNKSTASSSSSVTVAAGAATAGSAASKSLKIVEENAPATPAAGPAAAPASTTKLPRTGRNTEALAWLAVVLLGSGAVLAGLPDVVPRRHSAVVPAPER